MDLPKYLIFIISHASLMPKAQKSRRKMKISHILPAQQFLYTFLIIVGPTTNTPDSDDRRCISEAFPDNVTIPLNNMADRLKNKIGNGNIPMTSSTAEHSSLKMIDHITKELVEFSQTSLNKSSNDAVNRPIL